MKIQMVDLKTQYNNIKAEIDSAIFDVLDGSNFIQGQQVKIFEEQLAAFNKVKYCISCGNGTDALQLAFMALDLKSGDEIILPCFTYIATIEAAVLLGIKTILVEPDPNTFNISITAIENAITPKTKAIVPVHLYGQCANMEEIIRIAKQHNLYVIEDTAQAIGAQYKFNDGTFSYAGTMGTIGTTSFFPSKNLGCFGDGGALFTNDENLAKRIRMIANHGQEKKYYHDIIGLNSRLDTLQAAILIKKLRYLNQYNEARQKAASFYDLAFKGSPHFTIPFRNPASTHVFHQYTLTLKEGNRDEFKKYLESKGIPSMIYYPLPAHLQSAYNYLEYKKGDFPITESLCEKVISLPIHTELTEEQLYYISENVVSFFR